MTHRFRYVVAVAGARKLHAGQFFARTWLGWAYALVLVIVSAYFYSLSANGQNDFANAISTSIDAFDSAVGWLTMITSAFLPSGNPYFWIPIVVVSMACCQWLLGAWWTLLVGFVGNFLPTLIGWLYSLVAIDRGWMSQSNRDAQNYGVSYVALSLLGSLAIVSPKLWMRITAAVVAILTIIIVFRFSSPWDYTIWMHLPALACGLVLGCLLRKRARPGLWTR